MKSEIQPMPAKAGVGFTSMSPLPEDMVQGYRYEQAGRYHNYHATPEKWGWPIEYSRGIERIVIDGFSPNLNKELHVGHLRNLVIAASLQRLHSEHVNTNFVALLGCSLGVKSWSIDSWRKWTHWTGYKPEIFYDVALPDDLVDEHPEKEKAGPLQPEIDKMNFKHSFWTNPEGEEILIRRSDGSPLYAFYDLAFHEWVNPTHYITGQEQRDHFRSLGFADKHLPMGLVLGDDGKKLKSRDESGMAISEALGLVAKELNETPEQGKLSWNIMCWNMLQPNREKDVKFQVENWVRPESPGLYITYTYSRVRSALARSLHKCRMGKYMTIVAPTGPDSTMKEQTLQDIDVEIMGVAEQYVFYRQQAIENFDPSPLANFAHTLARSLNAAYEKEQIKNGRRCFCAAIGHGLWRLHNCMEDLGMFPLETV